MNHAVNRAEIYERAVVGKRTNRAGELLANLNVSEEVVNLLPALCADGISDRADSTLALVVNFYNL
jgi:alpha-D-ribose 1-methylphosphonate 5-triphosphate synthase subunit PhnL